PGDADGSARSVCISMNAPITTAASVIPPIIKGALLRGLDAGGCGGGGGAFLDGLDITPFILQRRERPAGLPWPGRPPPARPAAAPAQTSSCLRARLCLPRARCP